MSLSRVVGEGRSFRNSAKRMAAMRIQRSDSLDSCWRVRIYERFELICSGSLLGLRFFLVEVFGAELFLEVWFLVGMGVLYLLCGVFVLKYFGKVSL